MDAEDARTISARARMTRCRCRLSLDRTAKLADITKCHLSYLPPDRRSTGVAAAVTEISTALHETTRADMPDIPARPVVELASVATFVRQQPGCPW